MRIRAIFALAATVFGAFLLAPGAVGAAAPSGYPPSTCASLAVSTTNPLPGEEITVSGTNFLPNASVRLELHSQTYVLKTVTTDSSGSFSTQVKLPNGVSGTHQIVAASGVPSTCPTPTVTLHIQKHGVEGSSAPPPSQGTSCTGVDVLLIVIAAAVLIGAGIALTRGGKRKHTGHPLVD